MDESVSSPLSHLLEDLFVNPPVVPTEAGFEGALYVGGYPGRTVVRFKRGNYVPQTNLPGIRNQLLWVTPDDSPPMLMWCDSKGMLYELKFYPYHTDTTTVK